MDVVTSSSPEEAIQALHSYMYHHAPTRGHFYGGDTQLRFVEYQPEKGSLFNSLWGLLLLGVLSLITGGAFFVIYLLYEMLIKDKEPLRIEVAAFPTPDGQTVLAISANKKKHERQVGHWAQANL